jgi:hypothetical protein
MSGIDISLLIRRACQAIWHPGRSFRSDFGFIPSRVLKFVINLDRALDLNTLDPTLVPLSALSVSDMGDSDDRHLLGTIDEYVSNLALSTVAS